MFSPTIHLGDPHPLGATCASEGVNFAIYSEHARAVELCLFDSEGHNERRLALPMRTDGIFHGLVPGLRAGALYGYRVHGRYAPLEGDRFNHHKLLLDPYARDWQGEIRLDDRDFGYTIGKEEHDLHPDLRDNADTMPKCRVADLAFEWGRDRHPNTPWSDTVIYECHVRGLTLLNPEVPEPLRGTYLGLCHPSVIEHLKRLGITAVELLPVQTAIHERRLVEKGLRNYWGYGTVGFFRPEARYAVRDALVEFKQMVKALHKAGLEVILDVVYNHTGEGSHLGPTLSFRGIDNRTYYRADAANPRFYRDYTGCGNTVNTDHPQVLQLVMDSLRFWVQEMHVDGFRYDLATALARHRSSFLEAVHQDPVLKRTKLIAEPWDLGEDGYQAGNFPPGWREWNDRFRDTNRRFWRGDPGQVSQLAGRLTGSSDLFPNQSRGPTASINFVTCHDGFTLRDLVSYNHKHNLNNGEENRDGSNNNNSWNCGHEGESDNPQISVLRLRQQKNLLATLMLSQGVPMLLSGDEFSRSQGGNNNAYCQDNELSWIDWSSPSPLTDFVRQLAKLRKLHPSLRRTHFLDNTQALWLHPTGRVMTEEDWKRWDLHSFGMFLDGRRLRELNRHGVPLVDDHVLLLANADDKDTRFRLAPRVAGCSWKVELSSCARRPSLKDGSLSLVGHSMALLVAPQ